MVVHPRRLRHVRCASSADHVHPVRGFRRANGKDRRSDRFDHRDRPFRSGGRVLPSLSGNHCHLGQRHCGAQSNLRLRCDQEDRSGLLRRRRHVVPRDGCDDAVQNATDLAAGQAPHRG